MITRGKSDTVRAYAAGILDGEGSICIQRIAPRKNWKVPQYVARLSILNTDYPLMEWLVEQFGGKLLQRKKQPNRRILNTWDLTNDKAKEFCEYLLPYLIVKSAQAKLLIKYMTQKRKYVGGDLSNRVKMPVEEITFRDSIVQQMQELNGHPQRLSEMAPRTGEAIV